MTRKITIRRQQNQWLVTRPTYGFGAAATITTIYPSGAAAIASITTTARGTSTPSVDRAPGLTLSTWAGRRRPVIASQDPG